MEISVLQQIDRQVKQTIKREATMAWAETGDFFSASFVHFSAHSLPFYDSSLCLVCGSALMWTQSQFVNVVNEHNPARIGTKIEYKKKRAKIVQHLHVIDGSKRKREKHWIQIMFRNDFQCGFFGRFSIADVFIKIVLYFYQLSHARVCVCVLAFEHL